VLVFWYVWRSGVRQAKDFDRMERKEAGLCPNCGYDVRPGHSVCPECGEALTDEAHDDPTRINRARLSRDWPDTPIDPVPPEPADALAEVHSTYDGWEADLIVQQFEARGVWSTIRQKDTTQNLGAVSRVVQKYRIVVPESELERAEAILNRFRGR